MSELNGKPSEILTWGEGASPNTHTEPVASREDGYFEGTAPAHLDADALPADHLNWLLRAKARYLNWLAGFAHREFDEIDDAVEAGLAWPERFDYVRQSAVVEPGSQNYAVQGAVGATPILGGDCDGRNIYYVQGAYLVCARLADPSTAIWDEHQTTAWGTIATDGRYVYVADTGVAGIRLHDPADGSIYATWNDHTGTYPTMISACGRWVALVDVGDDEVVHVYGHTSAGVKTYLGSYDNQGPITAMCVQGNALYIGSSAATVDGKFLRRISLPTLIADWEIDPGWSSTPTFQTLRCDGRFLYGGTDRDEVVAGTVYGQIHCFGVLDGTRLWTTDLGAGVDVNVMSHDQELVLGFDNAGVAYFVEKQGGRLWLTVSAALHFLDGVRAIGASGNNIIRHWLDRGAVRYQMAPTYDQYRPMPWMVATPLK